MKDAECPPAHVDLTCIICKVNVCDILYKFIQQIYCIFLLESLLFAFVQAMVFIASINQNQSVRAFDCSGNSEGSE